MIAESASFPLMVNIFDHLLESSPGVVLDEGYRLSSWSLAETTTQAAPTPKAYRNRLLRGSGGQSLNSEEKAGNALSFWILRKCFWDTKKRGIIVRSQNNWSKSISQRKNPLQGEKKMKTPQIFKPRSAQISGVLVGHVRGQLPKRDQYQGST